MREKPPIHLGLTIPITVRVRIIRAKATVARLTLTPIEVQVLAEYIDELETRLAKLLEDEDGQAGNS